MSCGILDGDTKKDEPPTENELHMLINGKPWPVHYANDPIVKSYPSTFFRLYQGRLEFIVVWNVYYQSPFREFFSIYFSFPEDYDLSTLPIPYTRTYPENKHPDLVHFWEWDYDVPISEFDRVDPNHVPNVMITYLDLDKGIIEVEFEGTLILSKDYMNHPDRPQYARWYGIDTLRITEGRISSVELKDLREQ